MFTTIGIDMGRKSTVLALIGLTHMGRTTKFCMSEMVLQRRAEGSSHFSFVRALFVAASPKKDYLSIISDPCTSRYGSFSLHMNPFLLKYVSLSTLTSAGYGSIPVFCTTWCSFSPAYHVDRLLEFFWHLPPLLDSSVFVSQISFYSLRGRSWEPLVEAVHEAVPACTSLFFPMELDPAMLRVTTW